MANNNGSGGRFIKTDRFGNAYQVVGCKENKSGFPVGYVTLGGKEYKLEPAESKKDGVHTWIRVTNVKKQARPTSM
jgi:hypothetical protein